MKQNTGKNSALSTSVKKHFSPHTAVSSLNTTLTHSVAASETEWICCRRAQAPRGSWPHAGISKHQGDRTCAAVEEGLTLPLQPASHWGGCEQMLSGHRHRVLLCCNSYSSSRAQNWMEKVILSRQGLKTALVFCYLFLVSSTCFYSCLHVLEGLMFHKFVFSASSPEEDPSRT